MTAIKHFVQYRNPERYSTPCDEVSASQFEVGTNKSVNELIGNRLWVICGEGRPRRYFLCKSYLVAEVGEWDERDFRFFVRGLEGIRFQPPVLLNKLPWFREFCRGQSNFSFGLNRIREEFVLEFEKLVPVNG